MLHRRRGLTDGGRQSRGATAGVAGARARRSPVRRCRSRERRPPRGRQFSSSATPVLVAACESPRVSGLSACESSSNAGPSRRQRRPQRFRRVFLHRKETAGALLARELSIQSHLVPIRDWISATLSRAIVLSVNDFRIACSLPRVPRGVTPPSSFPGFENVAPTSSESKAASFFSSFP